MDNRNHRTNFIVVSILILLCYLLDGCSLAVSENEKSVSYSELDSDGQAVIDIIYNYYDLWDSVHDSGQDFYCTNVGFFYDESTLVFATYYSTAPNKMGKLEHDSSVISTSGFFSYYVVDKDNETLEAYSGSGSLYGLSMSQIWDVNVTEQEQKDILAEQYSSFISKS